MLREHAEFHKALADETRLRCLALIASEGELCVCELTEALELSQPKISRHLATLKHAGIVTDRREGQWVYYFLNPRLAPWQASMITTLSEALADTRVTMDDQNRLQSMHNRPQPVCCL